MSHLAEHDDAVEELEHFAARLVDGGEDSGAVAGYPDEGLGDGVSRVGIEAGHGLVEKDYAGRSNELYSDAGPLALASRDALLQLIAHESVGAPEEAELSDPAINDPSPLVPRSEKTNIKAF